MELPIRLALCTHSVNVNTTDATAGVLPRQTRQPVLPVRHCYRPLRIHTPYMTPYETRSMRALAALRMVWASARTLGVCVPPFTLGCV
jgi:hypothetical protein